jgi:hypothetical protein
MRRKFWWGNLKDDDGRVSIDWRIILKLQRHRAFNGNEHARKNRRTMFSMWSAPRSYREDSCQQLRDPSFHQSGRPATNPQVSEKKSGLKSKWVLYSKTDWPTDRRS